MRRLLAAFALVFAFIFGHGLTASVAAQGIPCSEYSPPEAAQAALDADPGQAQFIDPDGDGIACNEGDTSGGDSGTDASGGDVTDGSTNVGDLNGDASGTDQTNDSSGDSGVVVGPPVADTVDTSVDGGTATEGGNPGVANTGTVGTNEGGDDAAVGDTGAVADDGAVADTADAAAAIPAAAVASGVGMTTLPVTGSSASAAAVNSSVAKLPNTGSGATVTASSAWLAALAFAGAVFLLGGAAVTSRRRS